MNFEHNDIEKGTTKANTNLKPTSKNLVHLNIWLMWLLYVTYKVK